MQAFAFLFLALASTAIPLTALVLAIVALKRANQRPASSVDEKRIVQLESRLRHLDQRLRALEPVEKPVAGPFAAPEPAVAPAAVPDRAAVPQRVATSEPAASKAAPRTTRPADALEQRIGARWATWVGVLSLIITVGLLLRWTFENNLIGPTGRVALGLVTGCALLAAGLALRRRRNLPFLAEGLAGGGLAILYLSLYAANTIYGLLATGGTFALMSAVTIAGIAVAVASDRQATAVLAVLGGLLTPVLVSTQHPDDRVLLTYLLVLGALVLGVAQRRSWIALNRLSFAGSMLLIFAALQAQPASPQPVMRLALLSALAALFAAVPLARAWVDRRPVATPDLWIVVGNAAAYYSAVYVTLERWQPRIEGAWALVLGVAYVAIARAYKRRVPGDQATVGVHLGNAIVFAAIAFPLALDGPWVTLAWAVQGAVLLWLASTRVDSTTVLTGGLIVLFLAVLRVVSVDPMWYPRSRPVWNVSYAVHLLVVAAMIGAGWPAGKRPDLRTALWFNAAGLLAVLLWREPTGLWPAGLLLVLMLVLAWLLRVQGDRAFLIATPLLGVILLVRLFVEDAEAAKVAGGAWLNGPFVLRLAACGALAGAGRLVSGIGASDRTIELGKILRGAAGVVLLLTLSIGWILRQGLAIQAARAVHDANAARHLQWKMQVGLSVLFTLYAAAALAWGFARRIPGVRYGALGLFGIVIVKVFLVDLAELQAIYRILSFFVLGLVLLGVSYGYQRLRPEGEREHLRLTMKPSRLIVCAAAVLSLWGVWGYDLWAPDEPYFAEGAREMVADGHWAVPHVNGEVTTDKPPLFFWLIALVSLPFGKVLSLTARLPSVLASLGTVWLTMRLGRRLAGDTAGTLSGVVLITTYLFWDKARTAQIDALLCFLVLVALSAFEAFRAGAADGRRAGLLFWTAAGAAVLAKGPVGVLIPAGIALTVLALDRDLGAWRRFAPWAGPAVFAAILGSWIAFATSSGHGDYSVWGAFEKHVMNRAIHGMHHRQPPWYYLTVLPVQLLPWSALVPGALLYAWRRRGDANDRFLLVHAIFVCVFFSIWTEKRDLYVLPAYPAFALLISRLLVAADDAASGLHKRWIVVPFVATGGLLLLASIGLPLAIRSAVPGLGVPWLPPAVALAGAGIGTLVAARIRRPTVTARTLAIGMGAVYLATVTFVYPRFDAIKSARALGERLREVAGQAAVHQDDVLACGLGNVVQGIAFYSDGVYARVVDDPDAIATHLSGEKTAYAVIDSKSFEKLPESVRASLTVSGRFAMSRLEVLIVAKTD